MGQTNTGGRVATGPLATKAQEQFIVRLGARAIIY